MHTISLQAAATVCWPDGQKVSPLGTIKFHHGDVTSHDNRRGTILEVAFGCVCPPPAQPIGCASDPIGFVLTRLDMLWPNWLCVSRSIAHTIAESIKFASHKDWSTHQMYLQFDQAQMGALLQSLQAPLHLACAPGRPLSTAALAAQLANAQAALNTSVHNNAAKVVAAHTEDECKVSLVLVNALSSLLATSAHPTNPIARLDAVQEQLHKTMGNLTTLGQHLQRTMSEAQRCNAECQKITEQQKATMPMFMQHTSTQVPAEVRLRPTG